MWFSCFGSGRLPQALRRWIECQEGMTEASQWEVVRVDVRSAHGRPGNILVRNPFLRLFSVSMFSAVILSVTYGIVYVCRSLSIMVDAFCCDVLVGSALSHPRWAVWDEATYFGSRR